MQSDLVTLCLAGVNGELEGMQAQFDERAAVGVVLAATGYPGSYDKNLPIGQTP